MSSKNSTKYISLNITGKEYSSYFVFQIRVSFRKLSKGGKRRNLDFKGGMGGGGGGGEET